MTDGIAAFLATRADEREAGARQVLTFTARSRTHGLTSTLWDEQDAGARTELCEAEAVRNILARYEDCLVRMEDPAYGQALARDQAREYEDFVLPALGAIWSDHPDYQAEEWKP